MSNPYIRKDPGDIMMAADWNQMQVQVRDEIHQHTHTGGDSGMVLGRSAIAPNAIDGSRIDPSANVEVGALKVNKREVLAEIDALKAQMDKNLSLKFDKTGGTVAGGLTVQGNLSITQALQPSAGNAETNGILFPKDAFGGSGDKAWMRYFSRQGEASTLELGIANDGDDHIVLNASGNVGIKTDMPQRPLHITGDVHTGGPSAGYSFANRSNNSGAFDESGLGNRWLWYSENDGGNAEARLQSGGSNLLRIATNGDLYIKGRVRSDSAIRVKAAATNNIRSSARSQAFVQMPNMSVTFSTVGANTTMLLLFKACLAPSQNAVQHLGHFILVVDGKAGGKVVDGKVDGVEFKNNFNSDGSLNGRDVVGTCVRYLWTNVGETNDVSITALVSLAAGDYTVSVQWRTPGIEIFASCYGELRTLIAIEL
jgi:hypothetical protein